MQDIVVDLGERGYPIQIGFDLLQSNERLRALAAGRSVCVISDENVGPLHAPALLAGLGVGLCICYFEHHECSKFRKAEPFAGRTG